MSYILTTHNGRSHPRPSIFLSIIYQHKVVQVGSVLLRIKQEFIWQHEVDPSLPQNSFSWSLTNSSLREALSFPAIPRLPYQEKPGKMEGSIRRDPTIGNMVLEAFAKKPMSLRTHSLAQRHWSPGILCPHWPKRRQKQCEGPVRASKTGRNAPCTPQASWLQES